MVDRVTIPGDPTGIGQNTDRDRGVIEGPPRSRDGGPNCVRHLLYGVLPPKKLVPGKNGFKKNQSDDYSFETQ